jgi:hypothetical protein
LYHQVSAVAVSLSALKSGLLLVVPASVSICVSLTKSSAAELFTPSWWAITFSNIENIVPIVVVIKAKVRIDITIAKYVFDFILIYIYYNI